MGGVSLTGYSSVAGGDALASPLQFFPHFFFRLLLHLSTVGYFFTHESRYRMGVEKSKKANNQTTCKYRSSVIRVKDWIDSNSRGLCKPKAFVRLSVFVSSEDLLHHFMLISFSAIVPFFSSSHVAGGATLRLMIDAHACSFLRIRHACILPC